MSLLDSFHAVARFGLGAKPDEIKYVSSDPRGWLKQQLKSPEIPDEVKERAGGDELAIKLIRAARKNKLGDAESTVISMRDVYIKETGNRFIAQIKSSQPFVERLTMFWSNHFTVSIQKNIVTSVANKYEVEAIRPHINGYFKDMLIAVVQHPAMILYLDNAQSFGTASTMGKRRKKGINENLAREILELHTLGVNGGYSQQDVIELAKIITGWSLEYNVISGPKMKYEFHDRAHEPGDKVLLGKRIVEDGENEGVRALTMLAQHPATAKHISTKLAKHFISDNPSQDSINIIARTFLESGGHIPTIMNKIIDLNETWASPLTKVKNPYEFAVSALRAINLVPNQKQVVTGLEALNFRSFNASSPAGFADDSESWVSPDAIMKRIEWSHKLSQRLQNDINPMVIAQNSIGPVMSEDTRLTISRAESGKDGIALLLASPEFQRR